MSVQLQHLSLICIALGAPQQVFQGLLLGDWASERLAVQRLAPENANRR